MEHLTAPLFIHRMMDEFGRPVGQGLDEFGYPTGPIPVEVEVGAAAVVITQQNSLVHIEWQSMTDAVPVCLIVETASVQHDHQVLSSCSAMSLAMNNALPWHEHAAAAGVCAFESSCALHRAYVTWYSAPPAVEIGIGAPAAGPWVSWLGNASAVRLCLTAVPTRSFVDARSNEAYAVLFCDITGAPLAFAMPTAVEYIKEGNKPGEIKLRPAGGQIQAGMLDGFAEGYIYRRGQLWQGIVPDGRSIGGEDLELRCLTFEALLGRWRLPRDWNVGNTYLAETVTDIVENRYETFSKSSPAEFNAAIIQGCNTTTAWPQTQSMMLGIYAGGTTSEASATFTWDFGEELEPWALRWRYRAVSSGREIEIYFRTSQDGIVWTEWTGANVYQNLPSGIKEYSLGLRYDGFGPVRMLQARFYTPSFSGSNTLYLYGLEMVARGSSGYTLQHTIPANEGVPASYKFDNATVLDALEAICSDAGYSFAVGPDKVVAVGRPGAGVPWIAVAGGEGNRYGAKVAEALVWGEASISNDLLVTGYGDGASALAMHKKDEASVEVYGARRAIATNPMIRSQYTQEAIAVASGMLAEMAWPRTSMTLKGRIWGRKGRDETAWAGGAKVNDAVAVVWPGNLEYGEELGGWRGGWFYVMEEQRKWSAGEGEAVELRLARRQAAQENAVAVAQVPVPVDTDTTAVRITLGSARR